MTRPSMSASGSWTCPPLKSCRPLRSDKDHVTPSRRRGRARRSSSPSAAPSRRHPLGSTDGDDPLSGLARRGRQGALPGRACAGSARQDGGMLAAGLALVASLCYGISNFVGPVLSRDLAVYPVLIAGQVVAFCVSVIVVGVAGDPVPDLALVGAAALAGIGNAWGLIAFYRAAAIGPLSIVTPIGSLSAVVPVLVGVSRGESLGPVKLTGMVLALGGVALAAPSPGWSAGRSASSARRSRVGAVVRARLRAVPHLHGARLRRRRVLGGGAQPRRAAAGTRRSRMGARRFAARATTAPAERRVARPPAVRRDGRLLLGDARGRPQRRLRARLPLPGRHRHAGLRAPRRTATPEPGRRRRRRDRRRDPGLPADLTLRPARRDGAK